MRCITDRFTNADARFFGFDSFEGLPERWGGVPAGEFSTGGAAPAIADPRVQFIHGWFQNTVPSFLAEHSFDNPVLVNFDADLYSSTLFLLTTLWHHVVEYDFVFDEFCGDEVVAMRDFACAYPVEFEFHGALLLGDAPMQVYGSMKRANF
jgi:hypothetical protein